MDSVFTWHVLPDILWQVPFDVAFTRYVLPPKPRKVSPSQNTPSKETALNLTRYPANAVTPSKETASNLTRYPTNAVTPAKEGWVFLTR